MGRERRKDGGYAHDKSEEDKNSLEETYSFSYDRRPFYYGFYLNYFTQLFSSFFEWKGLPSSIDPKFIEKNLITRGYLGFFHDESYGCIIQKGTLSSGFDIYDNPTTFTPYNAKTVAFTPRQINWYKDDNDIDGAVIIQHNVSRYGSAMWLPGLCAQLAELEQIMQMHRLHHLMPFIIRSNMKTMNDTKMFMDSLLRGELLIDVYDREDNESGISLDERISAFQTGVPDNLASLHDEKQRIIAQILTLGCINNNAVDKKERLTVSEAISNNGLIAATIESYHFYRRLACDLINTIYGPLLDEEVSCDPSERIITFNIEKVTDNIMGETDNTIFSSGIISGAGGEI